MKDIDRLANCGIYIQHTTPNQGYARFYVAKYVPNGPTAWKLLFADGWHRWNGGPWHVVYGTQVPCPTFEKPSEALAFALEVESRLGDLVYGCPVQ